MFAAKSWLYSETSEMMDAVLMVPVGPIRLAAMSTMACACAASGLFVRKNEGNFEASDSALDDAVGEMSGTRPPAAATVTGAAVTCGTIVVRGSQKIKSHSMSPMLNHSTPSVDSHLDVFDIATITVTTLRTAESEHIGPSTATTPSFSKASAADGARSAEHSEFCHIVLVG